jgi:hypothetical protein
MTKKDPEWQKLTINASYNSPNITLETQVCRLRFDIENDLTPPILMYYRLSNFFQNHRRYVKSFDQNQLNGKAQDASQIRSGDCSPLNVEESSGKPYYPCGLIANSLFNDTLNSPQLLNPGGGDSNPREYRMTNSGIAWSSDKDLYKKSEYTTDQVVPPPNWRRKYPTYNDSFPLPDLHNDESFQVWMRTAGLPTFSKLSLRQDDKNKVMERGRYQVDIWNGNIMPPTLTSTAY